MRPHEVLDLIAVPRIGFPTAEQRLAKILTAADFRRRARRRLPKPVFDYLEGGADGEVSLRLNLRGFDRYAFVPDSLVDVTSIDTATSLLGTSASAPIGLAPTGYTRMMHPEGELAVARAAAAAGVPYCLSTVATTTIESVTSESRTPPWQQLYMLKDRGVTADMIARARRLDSPALVLAVDTAVSGNRIRDHRNGLAIPPKLTAAVLAQIALKPGYWADVLTHPSYDFANVKASAAAGTGLAGSSVAEIGAQFDPALGWDDVSWIRERWDGPLLLKGVLSAADSARAVRLGVDGVWLSNHGGRQLDRAIAPIDHVAEVRQAVPEATVFLDSGVRSGGDVAIALARGADAAFIGRPYLWALAADGAAGVARLIEILAEELRRTMALLGVTDVAALRARGDALVRAMP